MELHPTVNDFVCNVLLNLDMMIELIGRMLNPLNAKINLHFV
jgi:hypothetical protein